MSNDTYAQEITIGTTVRIGRGKVEYTVATFTGVPDGMAVVTSDATGRNRTVERDRLVFVAPAPEPEKHNAHVSAFNAQRDWASDLMPASGESEEFESDYVESRCPACGAVIDFCPGHGETGDPGGFAILQAHDSGDHYRCAPAGCEEASDIARAHDAGNHALCIPAYCLEAAASAAKRAGKTYTGRDGHEYNATGPARDTRPGSVAERSQLARAAREASGAVEPAAPVPVPEVPAAPETPSASDVAMYLAGVRRRTQETVKPNRAQRRRWAKLNGGFRRSGALAVALATVGALLFGPAVADDGALPVAGAAPAITEDDERWNCATMGDRECGPNFAPLHVPAQCMGLKLSTGNVLYLELRNGRPVLCAK